MGYGGVVNKITDPFGLGGTPNPQPPKPGKVGADYLGLIQAFAQGAPTAFDTAGQFTPKYAGLDVSTLSSILPQLGDAWKGINPGESDLLGDLTSRAKTQLDSGASLDPELERLFQQSVRGGQAARGMGHGPSDVFQESLGLTELGNTLRQQRQGFASNVAGANNEFETAPLLATASGITGGAPAQQMSTYDIFNTAYNARAAASIAKANNQASEDSSY